MDINELFALYGIPKADGAMRGIALAQAGMATTVAEIEEILPVGNSVREVKSEVMAATRTMTFTEALLGNSLLVKTNLVLFR